MERKIGETFEYKGKIFKVAEAKGDICIGCFFNGRCFASDVAGECESEYRSDKKEVIFVEIQEQPQQAEQPQEAEEGRERRIGEVFEYEGKKLKVVEGENECDKCYFYNKIYCTRIDRIAGACLMSRRIDNKSVKFVEVMEEPEKQQAEQPQGLNLCEILKYCPQGETFWSPMLDGVKFSDIDDERQMIIVETVEGHFTWEINHDGTISIDEVTSPEIMLYPSREQRDWTKVKYEPKKERFDPKTLKAFDKIIFKGHGMWFCGLFSHIHNSYACVGETYYKCVIPYNDDTKHLLGTKEEAPDFYKYWED